MTNEPQPNKLIDTQPIKVKKSKPDNLSSTEPQVAADLAPQKKPKRSFWGFWLSLLVIVVALGLGSMAGYGRGVSERMDAQSTQVTKQLDAQLALVQQDIDAGRYGIARQRLEYIIKQDPSFPGATDKLAQVMVASAITPSPVPTETPTLTPTPDLRNQEAIYAQARQQYDAKEWTGLMESLDSLRKADPTYNAVIVDGMYYTALRNRGMDQILGIGVYTISNMEGGIYDLTRAEKFGPLDGYADGLRNFTRMYIIGASFWDVNWPQAVDYFRQVSQYAPNLRDSSNVTSNQRLYRALLKYGDQKSGNPKLKDRCGALDLWNEASNIAPLTDEYANKYRQLDSDCNPPTEPPPPGDFTDPNIVPTPSS